MEFKEIVKKRYACKKFDGRKIPENKINELLEIIRMAPSSFNVQPWKIKIITDQETKEKLLPVSNNQIQVTTCSHLLVFCIDTNFDERVDLLGRLKIQSGALDEDVDNFLKMVKGAINSKDKDSRVAWAQRQLYISVGNALNGAKSLGFDSCPMEGFKPEKYSRILKLSENLIPTCVVPVGYAADEFKPKLRFSKEEVFFK